MWLLQAYLTSKQKDGKTVHIIPVTFNYERMFELRNLATEMVSGDVPEIAFLKLASMIEKQKSKIGRIFCNFGNPINVKDYLANINVRVLNANNIDDNALRLTEKLYKE